MSTSTEELASPAAPNGLAEHSHVGGRSVGIGSHAHRVGSRDVPDHPVPTGREESWRFTPLRRLRGLQADAPLTGEPLAVDVSAPASVTVRTLTGADATAVKGASGYRPLDRASARAWAESSSVFLIRVPDRTVVDEPIVVAFTGGSAADGIAGHLVIQIGTQSAATVVVSYTGSAALTENVEIAVGAGATLSYVSLQDWSADAVHLSHQHIRVGRDAVVKHAALTFGGDVVRIVGSTEYDGQGGDVEMVGLYFADAGQHLEHRLFIDHAARNCKSRVLYKGALQGRNAHAVWIGDVLIRASAEGTDTYELNRNLLLTEGARADSVPNLEIETGQIVGAGHASATGRFDDEQLFYLLSRGIPQDIARRLVVRGFFGEVLGRIGVPFVVERVTELIERELAVTGA